MASGAGSSTPKGGDKSSLNAKKKQHFHCTICCEVIHDAVGKKPGQNSVFCDSSCASWLHRQCAGLSKDTFAKISKSSSPFLCPQCRLDKQANEIDSLKSMISNLSSEIA